MSAINRAALVALLNSKVLTGGNQTTAQGLRDTFNSIIESVLNIIDDKDANGGYLGLDVNGIANVTKIKQLTPQGYFLRDDGTWQSSAASKITESFTIVGNTQLLSFAPLFSFGHYIDGQYARVGASGRILSIVGNLITFDQDYTGQMLDSVYEY